MSRNVPGLILAYKAETYIGPYCVVRYGSDGAAGLAESANDALLGVSTDIEAQIGETVDVVRTGVTPVLYGGVVVKGDPLTADAGGVAIKATAGQQIIGYAEVSGVADDIGSLIVQRGKA